MNSFSRLADSPRVTIQPVTYPLKMSKYDEEAIQSLAGMKDVPREHDASINGEGANRREVIWIGWYGRQHGDPWICWPATITFPADRRRIR